MRKRHGFVAVLVFLFLTVCMVVSLFNTGFRRTFFSAGATPETLGLAVAREKGCFHCHGSFGAGGAPNPGLPEGIPAWQGATFMMSMENESELVEWIMDGAPARLRQSETWRQKQQEAIIHMPAYRKIITPGELKDLIAFYHAVSGTVRPDDDQARLGYRLAREKGCFTCHGPGGRIDMVNPFSVSGYIPAWNGPDYPKLVHNDEELREWIMEGRNTRLESKRFARWFLGRQAVDMPAYKDRLTEDELQAIMTYIKWLRNPDAPDHQPRFTY